MSREMSTEIERVSVSGSSRGSSRSKQSTKWRDMSHHRPQHLLLLSSQQQAFTLFDSSSTATATILLLRFLHRSGPPPSLLRAAVLPRHRLQTMQAASTAVAPVRRLTWQSSVPIEIRLASGNGEPIVGGGVERYYVSGEETVKGGRGGGFKMAVASTDDPLEAGLMVLRCRMLILSTPFHSFH